MMSRSQTNKPSMRGRPAQTAEQADKMRLLIAQTAERLFQQEGYANVSIRRLAKEVGCSPMTLYKYYDSKIVILQTLWGVVFQELFAELTKKLEPVANPKDRLHIASKHYVDFWLANPDNYRMVFMAEGVTQPEVSLFVGNPEIMAGFEFFHQAIADASNSKDAKALKLRNDLLIASLHGIAHTKITISGHPWSDSDTMIEQLVERLI